MTNLQTHKYNSKNNNNFLQKHLEMVHRWKCESWKRKICEMLCKIFGSKTREAISFFLGKFGRQSTAIVPLVTDRNSNPNPKNKK